MRTTHRSRRSIPARSTFAGFRFPPDVIVLAARWYLRFGLSYRDVEELLAERGVQVDTSPSAGGCSDSRRCSPWPLPRKWSGPTTVKTHRVLVAISHSAGGAFPDDEQAAMGRGVQRTIARVDPEAVNMDDPGVVRDRRRGPWPGSVAAGRRPPRPPRRHQVPMRFVSRRPAVGCPVGSMLAPLLRPT
jgi:hypothetical protein